MSFLDNIIYYFDHKYYQNNNLIICKDISKSDIKVWQFHQYIIMSGTCSQDKMQSVIEKVRKQFWNKNIVNAIEHNLHNLDAAQEKQILYNVNHYLAKQFSKKDYDNVFFRIYNNNLFLFINPQIENKIDINHIISLSNKVVYKYYIYNS